MPPPPQLIFELHALYIRDLLDALVRQNDVWDGKEKHERPHEHGQQFAVVHRLHKRGPEGLDDFIVPVKANEPKEHNADVHIHIEDHGRDPAYEHVHLPGTEARVPKDLERESQAHEKVSHDYVLEIDDETLGAGHVKEYPSRYAIEEDPRDEDHSVQHGNDLLRDQGVPGAGLGRTLSGGCGVVHLLTSGGSDLDRKAGWLLNAVSGL